ncbi:LysR family transcriptional regulator [Brevibacterium spongiae]|uniref:LysR family transcriptional regulator n=1 Tax=Brevibacterium spongiae TaxID=2909672 RepID=A0ABY5SQI5_9MICO|nr:LysR family transcriptional regulator [Brevibacterium spongiae]UVI36808.1 LysR family transcriptional regulator [Brevibacterium spongiae]
MDPRHLELLRQLDERGSVTAVAEATFRTPSAVSQQLKAATREFGHTLVEPAGRGLRLTPAGRLLASGGRQVAAAIADVQADWEDYLGEDSGEVHIAGLPSALTYLIPSALTELRATSPAITVHTSDVDIAEHEFAGLLGDVDLVIAHSLISQRPVGTEGLTVDVLAREPIDVAVADDHRLAGRSEVSPDDLTDEQWIGVPRGYPFDTILTSIEHVTGHPLTVTQRIRDNRLIEALVAAGDHIALLPRFTTPRNAGLRLIPLAGISATRWVVAVRRSDATGRRAVTRVLEALRSAAARVSPGAGTPPSR